MFSLQVMAVLVVVAVMAEARPGIPEHHITKEIIDYHAHPKYKFDYAVHDPHTGDVKNQWEIRDGDVVKGSYSIMDSDGTMRTVEYTADKHNGFNAVVKRTGHAYHPTTTHHHHELQHHQLQEHQLQQHHHQQLEHSEGY